jgi:hypothetical protein
VFRQAALWIFSGLPSHVPTRLLTHINAFTGLFFFDLHFVYQNLLSKSTQSPFFLHSDEVNVPSKKSHLFSTKTALRPANTRANIRRAGI